MNPFDVLVWLRKHEEIRQAYHIHSIYEGIRKRPDGSAIGVTLTIEQYHSVHGSKPSYRASAVTKDGKTASGNQEPSPVTAVAGVHWKDLDK